MPDADVTLKDEGPCQDDPADRLGPNDPYDLPGPQVEPGAAYWLLGNHPRVVELGEVTARLPAPAKLHFPVDAAKVEAEAVDLIDLAKKRGDPLPNDYLCDFLNLQDPPFGAAFNTTRKQYRVADLGGLRERITLPPQEVQTGGELARMFEDETPGLLHRHLLQWLLYRRDDVSPPRQARIWMALDVTLYSALAAAWHFKWAAGPGISYRLRPYEYERGERFAVLFDRHVRDDGSETFDALGRSVGATPRTCPCPSPGTPRHPAYPSGHSTYSAAASRILEYFFSPGTLGADDDTVIAAEPTGLPVGPQHLQRRREPHPRILLLARHLGHGRRRRDLRRA